MRKSKNLKEGYVHFLGAWMAGAAVGHILASVIGKIVVWGLWFYFVYWLIFK